MDGIRLGEVMATVVSATAPKNAAFGHPLRYFGGRFAVFASVVTIAENTF